MLRKAFASGLLPPEAQALEREAFANLAFMLVHEQRRRDGGGEGASLPMARVPARSRPLHAAGAASTTRCQVSSIMSAQRRIEWSTPDACSRISRSTSPRRK